MNVSVNKELEGGRKTQVVTWGKGIASLRRLGKMVLGSLCSLDSSSTASGYGD